MSKYTTELRFICEEMSGLRESVGYYKVNEVIDKSRANIFSFDYPIFDTNYKSDVNGIPVIENEDDITQREVSLLMEIDQNMIRNYEMVFDTKEECSV